MNLPLELLDAVAELGRACQGDVPGLVAAARGIAPGPLADDASLARACEAASGRAVQRGDRGGAWWLSCAAASLRASPLSSAQDEAERTMARVTGELSQSAAALAPIPEGARWLLAGYGEAAPDSLELARRNATTYLERLEAELAGRAGPLRARWEAAPVEPTRVAIEAALASYAVALASTRAGLARVADQAVARGLDPQRAAAALDELDDAVGPPLRARIAEIRATIDATRPVARPYDAAEDRPSFVGAAPPSFHAGQADPAVPVPVPAASLPSAASTPIEDLDAAMRAAFERAWTMPDPANVAAFEAAVRARYERETAAIADPEQRRQALDHYVAHALAQLRR